MPLLRIIQIHQDQHTKIGIWRISEPEEFFKSIQPSREIYHPHKRLQHLAVRYLLHTLETDFPLCQIEISPSKKPYLPKGPYFFSLAHSGDYAVAIVSKKGNVGIDVEVISTKVQRVAHKFLNPEEDTFLNEKNQIEHLTVCWTAKEAVYKWNGGRGIDFRKNIHLQPFTYASSGSLTCHFIKEGQSTLLQLYYRVERDYCVAWVLGK